MSASSRSARSAQACSTRSARSVAAACCSTDPVTAPAASAGVPAIMAAPSTRPKHGMNFRLISILLSRTGRMSDVPAPGEKQEPLHGLNGAARPFLRAESPESASPGYSCTRRLGNFALICSITIRRQSARWRVQARRGWSATSISCDEAGLAHHDRPSAIFHHPPARQGHVPAHVLTCGNSDAGRHPVLNVLDVQLSEPPGQVSPPPGAPSMMVGCPCVRISAIASPPSTSTTRWSDTTSR